MTPNHANSGFSVFASEIFFSRRHRLICFSRSSATKTSVVASIVDQVDSGGISLRILERSLTDAVEAAWKVACDADYGVSNR